MNTFLSSAQDAQMQSYRQLAKEVLAPVAEKLNKHEHCLKEFLQQIAQRGYLGINVPKEYGGQGGTLLDVALLCEAFGEYDPAFGLTIGDHAALIELVKRFGTDQQKSRYLPTLAHGEGFGSLAFFEQSAGTDFQNVQTSLQEGKLTGTKTWTVTGDFATLFAVTAKENDRLVIVLMERPGDASFKLVKEHRLIGLRSAYVNDVQFSNAAVPPENRILEGDKAKSAVIYCMSVAKTLLSAAGLGMLEAATALAVDHAKERQQFGTSISTFQGIQWKLADMGVETAAARLQVYRSAWSHDEDFDNFIKNAAMCKFITGRAARFHSGEALQIMGAAGLVEDSIMARFYDDGKVMEIADGTAEFQKMLLVDELNI